MSKRLRRAKKEPFEISEYSQKILGCTADEIWAEMDGIIEQASLRAGGGEGLHWDFVEVTIKYVRGVER